MKQVKYRLWCNNKKEWEKDEWHLTPDGRIIDSHRKIEMRKETHFLNQFTGLFDKQGIEIYEGDIQRQILGDHYWIYVVKSIGGQFGNQLFSITIKDNLCIEEFEERYTYIERTLPEGVRNYVKSGDNIEVIGNIYEHKHLLRG